MENLMLSVSEMHCATCAQKIEKVLAGTKGVLSVAVNFSTETAAVSYDEHVIDEKKIFRIIEKVGYTAEKSIPENQRQKERRKKTRGWQIKFIVSAVLTAVVISGNYLYSFIPWMPEQFKSPILFVLTLAILYIGAFSIIKNTIDSVLNFSISKDLLPGIGIAILILYAFVLTVGTSLTPHISRHLLYGTVTVIITVLAGLRWYELHIEKIINENIENLINLKPKRALVERHGTEMEIKSEDLKIGDMIKVKSGETIPADGIIIEGSTTVNEAIITGSGTSIEKKSGDEVLAATVNLNDTVLIKVTQVGENTTLSQILTLLEDTKKHPGKMQKSTKTIRGLITVLVIIIAIGIGIMWNLIGGGMFMGIITGVSVLIVASPEAFNFGTNTPFTFGIEKAVLKGALFKGGSSVEEANKIKRIVFDKTGILTHGIPEITNIIPKEAFNEKRLLILVGSLENSSAHPFAETIVEYCKKKRITLKKAYDFKNIEGLGILGIVDGQEIITGNMKLMEKSNVQMNHDLLHKAEILSKNVRTPIYIARNRELIGVIGIADTIKETAKEGILELNKKGYVLSLVTGDNEKIANHIGEELRIKEIFADMLQKEKLETIQNFQEKKERVAFVGHGISDGTILAQADVGIALGTGTDTTLEASDITFVSDDIRLIGNAFSTASHIKKIASQNMQLSWLYHIIVIPIAAGAFYPLIGIIMHPVIAPLLMGLFFLALAKSSMRLRKLI
jgi:Cu+-exporting ATPase